jgi:hypothetical protein
MCKSVCGQRIDNLWNARWKNRFGQLRELRALTLIDKIDHAVAVHNSIIA